MSMKKNKSVDLLIAPSFFSTCATLTFVLYIFVTNIWTTLKNYSIVQQLSELLKERKELLESTDIISTIFSGNILGSKLLNEVFYILSWALVGILVYFCFLIFTKGFDEFMRMIGIRNLVSNNKSKYTHEYVSRLLFRSLIFITIMFYLLMFLQVLLPISISSIIAGSGFSSLDDIKYLIIGLVLLILTTHLFTILIRLFFMRVRVFGGIDDVVLND